MVLVALDQIVVFFRNLLEKGPKEKSQKFRLSKLTRLKLPGPDSQGSSAERGKLLGLLTSPLVSCPGCLVKAVSNEEGAEAVSMKIVLEINHPRGEMDLLCPCFFCDDCGQRILDDKLGNYLWEQDRETFEPTSRDLVTVHKACTGLFEQQFGTRKWPWDELRRLPARLSVNMGLLDPMHPKEGETWL